jgi:hypothetical protein
MRTAYALVAAALLLALLAWAPESGAEVTIASATFFPAEPHPGDNITFTTEVNDSYNVSKAYLVYCSVTQGYCYPPREMKYIGEGNFSVGAGKFEEGEWKYNINLTLKDGNTTATPDTHFIVKKETPIDGGGDHNNTTTGNGSVKDNKTVLYVMYGAVGSMVGITLVAAAGVLRRRRKGPEGM